MPDEIESKLAVAHLRAEPSDALARKLEASMIEVATKSPVSIEPKRPEGLRERCTHPDCPCGPWDCAANPWGPF